MAVSNQLRALALTLTRERIVTISRQLEVGITTPEQHEALYLEVDRLVGTAMQVQLPEIARAGQVLQQRLGGIIGSLREQHVDHSSITEAFDALQIAVARAVAAHEDIITKTDTDVISEGNHTPSVEQP